MRTRPATRLCVFFLFLSFLANDRVDVHQTRRQHFFKGSVYLAKMASHIAAAIASADEEENVILQRRGQVTFKDLLTLTVSDAVLSLPRQLVAIEVVWNACEAISELVFDGSSLFIWSRFVISFYGLTVLLVQRSSPVSPSGTPPPSSLAPS